MWMDEDGVTHSVALPRPAEAMSRQTLTDLEALSPEERDRACELLEEYYRNEYVGSVHPTLSAMDLAAEGAPLPSRYVTARITSADDVVAAVRAAEIKWLVDVYEAFQDYLDQTRAALDLNDLPPDVRQSARVDSNGEVLWPTSQVASAVRALAAAGRVVRGLDVRDYDQEGRFVEVAWSDYDGSDPTAACTHALAALSRRELPGDWVLVTW